MPFTSISLDGLYKIYKGLIQLWLLQGNLMTSWSVLKGCYICVLWDKRDDSVLDEHKEQVAVASHHWMHKRAALSLHTCSTACTVTDCTGLFYTIHPSKHLNSSKNLFRSRFPLPISFFFFFWIFVSCRPETHNKKGSVCLI